MSGLYLRRLQYIQNPSTADTPLMDTDFGPIWACAIANDLAYMHNTHLATPTNNIGKYIVSYRFFTSLYINAFYD